MLRQLLLAEAAASAAANLSSHEPTIRLEHNFKTSSFVYPLLKCISIMKLLKFPTKQATRLASDLAVAQRLNNSRARVSVRQRCFKPLSGVNTANPQQHALFGNCTVQQL
jgi:hypothetical protein